MGKRISFNDDFSENAIEDEEYTGPIIEIRRGWVESSGLYTHISDGQRVIGILDVVPNDTLVIVTGAGTSFFAVKTLSNIETENGSADFSSANGFTQRIQIAANTAANYTIPSDVNYIVMTMASGSWGATPPVSVKLNGESVRIPSNSQILSLMTP